MLDGLSETDRALFTVVYLEGRDCESGRVDDKCASSVFRKREKRTRERNATLGSVLGFVNRLGGDLPCRNRFPIAVTLKSFNIKIEDRK
jgi:hypothetical protein